MPKKFVGENSKAVAARARKSANKDAVVAKKQQETEDAYWKDDNKHITKKLQRKEENEKKKQQQLDKKAELKALLDKEMDQIIPVAKQAPSKLTRAQIQAEADRRNATIAAVSKPPKTITQVEQPLEENINRYQPDEIANTIDEALAMLCVKENATGDKHPEKRIKAAYLAYEEKNLPRLKQDNPTLRLTQVKQMLFKEWSKSPDNPLNQAC